MSHIVRKTTGTLILAALSTLLLLTAGGCRDNGGGVPDAAPSMYFWRTTFNLDSSERDFIVRHGVRKLYVRYFDVVLQDDSVPMPNATLRFPADSVNVVPDSVEVIPVVFIVEQCLRHNIDGMAGRIVQRVAQMNETNGLPAPREVQIDCDWTARSLERYYAFLREVVEAANARGMRVSTTIRLHQLSMPAPPVDYGVLMVYNTGSASTLTERNPILDIADVKPYLNRLGSYDLPLCAAYPCYQWQLLYRGTELKALLHDENLADTTLYQLTSPGRYRVIASRDIPELSAADGSAAWVTPGDEVVVREVDAATLREVALMLEDKRPGINAQVIMYALDTKNINRYTDKQYETFLHP